MKIIRDAKYGEILGAHIIGAHATEMIHELAVARENEFTVEEIESRDPRAPDAVRGDRGGGARLDGAMHRWRLRGRRMCRPYTLGRLRRLSSGSPISAACRTPRRWRSSGTVARDRIAGVIAEDVLLLVEHPPVVTLGRSAKAAHLTASPELLAARGVELFEVERGGDVTFHGPGQLVGYPVIDLKRHEQDLHWYLRQFEGALIDALATLGIAAARAGLTGVWTEKNVDPPSRRPIARSRRSASTRGTGSRGMALR